MAVKTYTEYLEEILKSQKQLQDEKLQNAESEYNTLKQQVKQQYSSDINVAQRMYDDYIDKSYVQKLIDKKQIEETMANMGLTDSGLNRTQQTAIELSHSNRVANYNALKQQKIDSLAQAMRLKITDLETKKAQSQQDIKEELYKGAEDKATKMYNDQESSKSKQEKEWQTIVNTLFDDDATSKEKNFVLEQYYLKYGLTDSEKQLINKANINYSSFDKTTQSEQTVTKTTYDIAQTRKEQLKNMCQTEFVSRREIANEIRLKNYNGTYDSYRKQTLQNWLVQGRINKTEYEFLLEELGLNDE